MSLESSHHKESLHQAGHGLVPTLTQSRYLAKYSLSTSKAQDPVIPSPALFSFDEQRPASDASGSRLPLVAECAAHLELLEVFYVLRQKILVSQDIDDAMNISPKRETKTGKKGDTKTFKDTTLWERRQKKWQTYLEFATLRFLAWEKQLKQDDVSKTPRGNYSLRQLPPLDVLMVWHSFFLNPRLFYVHCGQNLIYQIRMPWKSIHNAIDSSDWTYTLDAAAAAKFESDIELPADLFKTFCDWKPPKQQWAPYWVRARTEPGPARTPLWKFSFSGAGSLYAWETNSTTPEARMAERYISMFKSPINPSNTLQWELRDAVVRQTSFVDKMNAHLWIRSPAVEGTLRRAIDRYDKFLKLLARDKKFIVVPTLDVDLAWHTHQCFSGVGYAGTMKARVGRFINHDDTIGKDTLGDGFAETRKLYRVYFSREYRICGCWDCEALLSAVEARRRHGELDMKDVADKVQEEVQYYRLVEIQRRKKQPLPLRPVTWGSN